MADEENRSFAPSQTETNRSRMQGGGVGATELNQQRDADGREAATSADRTDAFDQDLDPSTNADRPSQADFGEEDLNESREGGDQRRDGWGLDPAVGRNEAGIGSIEGDLGAGTPANVDIHKLGQEDHPEQDWGEPAEGAVFSSTNTNRGGRTELERGQGAKTRQHNKDTMSRRI